MWYAWKYHPIKQWCFKMKFYSTLLLAEDKMMKKRTGYMPRVIELLFHPWYTCKTWTIPNFSSPWLNNSIFYSLHVRDWCSSNFSTIQVLFHYSHQFPHSVYFGTIYAQLRLFLWQLFLKTFPKRKYVSTNI